MKLAEDVDLHMVAARTPGFADTELANMINEAALLAERRARERIEMEDRYLLTEEELNDRLTVLLGGRAGEVVSFGHLSTGAADDLQRASQLARRMVVHFGMLQIS